MEMKKRPKSKPENIEQLKKQLEMYRLIFDSIYNGCVVTDPDGYITHFNKPYGEFLGLDPEDQIGKHCTEVIENTRMHLVAKTGQPEINHPHRIMGQEMVVQRIPIKKNGKVIAVFGQVMFKNVRDVKKLAERLNFLESKVRLYEQELISLRSTKYTIDSIVGVSDPIKQLKKEVLKAARTKHPVLILGESGTGKELFAQAIHHESRRKMYPFVRINCAAIPKDLLESELFGYERGAFTGASPSGKPGKFELANRGTVFLDEIGDLPLEMQPKLLRVIEDREFERVGGTKIIRSDFRIIAASNQDLEELVHQGKFRKDLYYRLNVIPLYVPPLRERREDIPPIIHQYLEDIALESGIGPITIDSEAEDALARYDWPGNVRELINVLERVVASLETNVIHLCDLPFYIYQKRTKGIWKQGPVLKNIQARAEREAIKAALEKAGNNKARAAQMLGVHRTLLYKKMKKYGLPL